MKGCNQAGCTAALTAAVGLVTAAADVAVRLTSEEIWAGNPGCELEEAQIVGIDSASVGLARRLGRAEMRQQTPDLARQDASPIHTYILESSRSAAEPPVPIVQVGFQDMTPAEIAETAN
jgi:hypothetical protein